MLIFIDGANLCHTEFFQTRLFILAPFFLSVGNACLLMVSVYTSAGKRFVDWSWYFISFDVLNSSFLVMVHCVFLPSLVRRTTAGKIAVATWNAALIHTTVNLDIGIEVDSRGQWGQGEDHARHGPKILATRVVSEFPQLAPLALPDTTRVWRLCKLALQVSEDSPCFWTYLCLLYTAKQITILSEILCTPCAQKLWTWPTNWVPFRLVQVLLVVG